jgi:hypothetical protein
VRLHNVGKLIQQQIRYNGKIFGNERGHCNEGWLYIPSLIFFRNDLTLWNAAFFQKLILLSSLLSLSPGSRDGGRKYKTVIGTMCPASQKQNLKIHAEAQIRNP